MAWKSDQQRKWGHTVEGEAALGGPDKVAEWDNATKGTDLPTKVGMKSVPLRKYGPAKKRSDVVAPARMS